MAWNDFTAAIAKMDLMGGVKPEASTYAGMTEMFLTPNIAASSPDPYFLTPESCFASVSVSDLPFNALFISEPNIIIMDWDTNILGTVEERLTEMQRIFTEANFKPEVLAQNKSLAEDMIEDEYDYEYWERLTTGLIEYYRNRKDPRFEIIKATLNLEHSKYKQAAKRLSYLSKGHWYANNEIDRESMEEDSIENQLRVLGEEYYHTTRTIFFTHASEELLKSITQKNFCFMTINLLDQQAINSVMQCMQDNALKLRRLNLTILLDELVISSAKLRQLISTLETLQKVMVTDTTVLLSHIADFSVCTPFRGVMDELHKLLSRIEEIEKEATNADQQIESMRQNYIKEFLPISIITTNKHRFYSDTGAE